MATRSIIKYCVFLLAANNANAEEPANNYGTICAKKDDCIGEKGAAACCADKSKGSTDVTHLLKMCIAETNNLIDDALGAGYTYKCGSG